MLKSKFLKYDTIRIIVLLLQCYNRCRLFADDQMASSMKTRQRNLSKVCLWSRSATHRVSTIRRRVFLFVFNCLPSLSRIITQHMSIYIHETVECVCASACVYVRDRKVDKGRQRILIHSIVSLIAFFILRVSHFC